jgi:hypothetical protein
MSLISNALENHHSDEWYTSTYLFTYRNSNKKKLGATLLNLLFLDALKEIQRIIFHFFLFSWIGKCMWQCIWNQIYFFVFTLLSFFPIFDTLLRVLFFPLKYCERKWRIYQMCEWDLSRWDLQGGCYGCDF